MSLIDCSHGNIIDPGYKPHGSCCVKEPGIFLIATSSMTFLPSGARFSKQLTSTYKSDIRKNLQKKPL